MVTVAGPPDVSIFPESRPPHTDCPLPAACAEEPSAPLVTKTIEATLNRAAPIDTNHRREGPTRDIEELLSILPLMFHIVRNFSDTG